MGFHATNSLCPQKKKLSYIFRKLVACLRKKAFSKSNITDKRQNYMFFLAPAAQPKCTPPPIPAFK